MNKKLQLLLLSTLALLTAGNIRAASTDALTVSITPNAYYAVVIDTANVTLDLGSVDLGVSTQTVRPSTVSIQSTFATTDLKIQGSVFSSGTPWTFDADTTSTEPDSLAAWATFTSIARSSAPAQSGDIFNGTMPGSPNSDVVDNNNRFVGSSTLDGTTNLFENNSDFDFKNMDDLPPVPDSEGRSHLWLYFRLPNATTSSDAQNISITITAIAPD